MPESELEKLDSLRNQGILSEEAYWDARSRLFTPAPPTGGPAPSQPPLQPASEAGAVQPSDISTAPAFPPSEPEHLPRAARHRRGRRSAGVFVALVALLLAGAGAATFLVLHGGSDKVTMGGTYTLVDDATAAANCEGVGVDEDIRAGAEVKLTGPDNKALATAKLSNGTASNGQCTYQFEFPSTTSGLAAYSVKVSTKATATRTRAQLKGDDWHFAVQQGPPTTIVNGELELSDFDTAINDCVGTGGYDDITEGTNVIIKDQSGRILGSGSLDAGTSSGASCTYTFAVNDVRQDQQQYTLEISHRGGLTKSVAEMTSDGWDFSVTLGN